MYQLPPAFENFISPFCDRKAFIQNYLNSNGIECPVMQMDGKNHLYVKFVREQYNPMFKIKTVIAHYDRVLNSPGANDNSAAVFCLLEWAVQLSKMKQPHNIRLIFTDGEEQGENGVSSQGAFPLAQVFRRLGILDDEIYVFDCMGRGDVPVICENNFTGDKHNDSIIKNVNKNTANFLSQYAALENKVQKILNKASGGKWFKLPCQYSDNASFIANGIPSVAITMLPSSEINDFLKTGEKPYTWKILHTPEDNLENLTPAAFEITAAILSNLALSKTVL